LGVVLTVTDLQTFIDVVSSEEFDGFDGIDLKSWPVFDVRVVGPLYHGSVTPALANPDFS